jgi:RNA polymerase sigma factor (TIGR02999 family)
MSIVKNEGDAALTQLLQKWSIGDEHARDELVPIVYQTLHRLAEHYLADERHAQTLQPTALVHEAYVRLVDQKPQDWSSRDHFYGVAAHLMRQILVDHARRRLSQKRGSGAVWLELDAAADVTAPGGSRPEILAINDALEDLAKIDPRKCKVIELRYFAGCTEEETARILSLSIATVRRDLRAGEAWLTAQLNAR